MNNSKAKSETRAKRRPEQKCCCYIGPTVIGVIQYGTMYAGSRADILKRPDVKLAVEKYPAVAELIVEGEALQESKAAIKSKCGALYHAYKAVAKK